MNVLELVGLATIIAGGAYLLIRWSTARDAGREFDRATAPFRELHRAGKITREEYATVLSEAEDQYEDVKRG